MREGKVRGWGEQEGRREEGNTRCLGISVGEGASEDYRTGPLLPKTF